MPRMRIPRGPLEKPCFCSFCKVPMLGAILSKANYSKEWTYYWEHLLLASLRPLILEGGEVYQAFPDSTNSRHYWERPQTLTHIGLYREWPAHSIAFENLLVTNAAPIERYRMAVSWLAIKHMYHCILDQLKFLSGLQGQPHTEWIILFNYRIIQRW